MAETIAITTQDLEPAVHLRDALLAEGFKVELLTAGERLADARDPVLLILTGALDEKRARRLLREANEVGGIASIGLAVLDPLLRHAVQLLRGDRTSVHDDG